MILFKPPALILETKATYRQPFPPFPLVGITFEIGFQFIVNFAIGFDASGVHHLITDGFDDPANWRMYTLYWTLNVFV